MDASQTNCNKLYSTRLGWQTRETSELTHPVNRGYKVKATREFLPQVVKF